jgi:predicted AAA+ superfamily ATPase
MKYIERIAEAELVRKLESSGAVLIRGSKACGKTEMGRRLSKSVLEVDNETARVRELMDAAPEKLLEGEKPRLIDEWQLEQRLWNLVRREVDRGKKSGQFILAGSANPNDDVRMHSGAGRFTIMNLRPMTLFELGHSSGEVAMESLFSGKEISGRSKHKLDDLTTFAARGGWPSHIGKKLSAAMDANDAYVDLLSETDVPRVAEAKRDPIKVRALLSSLARNVSTMADIETLKVDINLDDGMSKPTIYEYLDALNRLMILDDVPAFNTHVRSTARLRKAAKRYLVDPSLAVSALGLNRDTLVDEIKYFGCLFENLVVRDLRVYAAAIKATPFHYRDASGLEVDSIIQKRNGEFIAIEIKLGNGRIPEAAKNLLAFKEKLANKSKLKGLAIVTGMGDAYTRKDGINVVPIGCLRSA